MNTIAVHILASTYKEASQIADKMNATLPPGARVVEVSGVIAAAIGELARAWAPDLGSVVPRDYASAEQIDREGRN